MMFVGKQNDAELLERLQDEPWHKQKKQSCVTMERKRCSTALLQ
jgi:hypothetical protein